MASGATTVRPSSMNAARTMGLISGPTTMIEAVSRRSITFKAARAAIEYTDSTCAADERQESRLTRRIEIAAYFIWSSLREAAIRRMRSRAVCGLPRTSPSMIGFVDMPRPIKEHEGAQLCQRLLCGASGPQP